MNYKKTIIISLLIMLTVGLYSVTHYVSNDGSDDNPGTASRPWQTIRHAVNQSLNNDTVVLEKGTYSASEYITKNLKIMGVDQDSCLITPEADSLFNFKLVDQSNPQVFVTLQILGVTFYNTDTASNIVAIYAKRHNVQVYHTTFNGYIRAVDILLPRHSSIPGIDPIGEVANCKFINNIRTTVNNDELAMIAIEGQNQYEEYAASIPFNVTNSSFVGVQIAPWYWLGSYAFIQVYKADSEITKNSFTGYCFYNALLNSVMIGEVTGNVTVTENSIHPSIESSQSYGQYDAISYIGDQAITGTKCIIENNNLSIEGNYSFTRSHGIRALLQDAKEIRINHNLCINFDTGIWIENFPIHLSNTIVTNNTVLDSRHDGIKMSLFDSIDKNFRNNISLGSVGSDLNLELSMYSASNILDHSVNLSYNAIGNLILSIPVELAYNFTIDSIHIDNTMIVNDIRNQFTDLGLPLSTSPTIDAGDPNLDGDAHGYYGDIDDQDPDGTRLDMGCYPYTHTYDEKHVHNGWNWVGFPRLRGTNGTEVINDVLPYTTTYRYTLLSFLNDTGDPAELPYVNTIPSWIENILLNSISGYKLEIDSLNFFADYQNYGTRIDPATTFGLYSDMPVGNWVDYFVPYAQNIKDAFGKYFDRVESVQGEDWFYHVPPETPKGEEQELYIWKTEGKDLEFGKAYVVVVNKDIPQFQWQSSYTVSTPNKPEKTMFFSYRDKADYETVEIAAMDSLENVQEIGVFEDGVCVGAKKFTGLPMQILCYTDRVNRSDSPLSIQVYTGSRSNSSTSYLTYDESEGQYSAAPILAGRQDYSIVRLLGNQSNSQAPSVAMMSQNYPNPFNSTTRISCYLPKAQKVKVSVYNVKGQIIRTLDDANKASGKFEIEWDGKNDSGQNVANGVYFYRLETKSKTILKKMLYLK